MTSQPVIVDVFVSVDGWAGSDNLPGYFGYHGPELQQWIDAEMAVPQIYVVGRRTYEMLAGLPNEALDESSNRMFAANKVVFSRTLNTVDWPNSRICHDDVVSYVEHLKTTGDVRLRTMGSLSIARQLLNAGLVDRLRLLTFPLLAGPDGREPFFADMVCIDLELAHHRVLDGRILLAEWVPTDRDIPRV